MFVHDVHARCLYMMYKRDVCTWCTSEMFVHDVQARCLYMMYMQDVCTWCTSEMFVHDVQARCLYMMYKQDVCTWCTCKMCVHDEQARYLYMMYKQDVCLKLCFGHTLVALPHCGKYPTFTDSLIMHQAVQNMQYRKGCLCFGWTVTRTIDSSWKLFVNMAGKNQGAHQVINITERKLHI